MWPQSRYRGRQRVFLRTMRSPTYLHGSRLYSDPLLVRERHQPQKRFAHAETTRMTARSSQCEQAGNVVQFPRDLKLAPSCTQCGIPMVVVRGEPEPNEPAAIVVTYRCTQCGLRERRMMR